MALFSIKLNENEEVLKIIRRHFSTFRKTFFKFLILSGIIFSFYKFMPDFQYKFIIIISTEALIISGLLYNYLIWYLVSIVITTQRIIDINQVSLIKRVVTEVILQDIAQISAYKEGFFQNLFNVGNVVIEVKEGGKIVSFSVKDPEGLMAKINSLKKMNGQERTTFEEAR